LTEKKAPVAVSKQAQQLKDLIARGKEQGYLTYAEVNDHLPNDIVDPEQIEDIVNMINDMGITVHEKAPDAESILLSDAAVSNDDDAAEEAEAALASVDAEFGRTTDPVRMYMREMGTVELLTRQGEIEIAKRIEEGLNQVRESVAMLPHAAALLLEVWDPIEAGDGRLSEIITGFIDPNRSPDTGKATLNIFAHNGGSYRMNKGRVLVIERRDHTPNGTVDTLTVRWNISVKLIVQKRPSFPKGSKLGRYIPRGFGAGLRAVSTAWEKG